MFLDYAYDTSGIYVVSILLVDTNGCFNVLDLPDSLWVGFPPTAFTQLTAAVAWELSSSLMKALPALTRSFTGPGILAIPYLLILPGQISIIPTRKQVFITPLLLYLLPWAAQIHWSLQLVFWIHLR